MRSIFSKPLTSEQANQHLAEARRQLDDVAAREEVFRTEELAVLELGDRERVADFRKRTANLALELSDDRRMAEARIGRLEKELVDALGREEIQRREAVVVEVGAATTAIESLTAKWASLAEQLGEVLTRLEDCYRSRDRALGQLVRFDELDTPQAVAAPTTAHATIIDARPLGPGAAARQPEPEDVPAAPRTTPWSDRGHSAAESTVLRTPDRHGNLPRAPQNTQIRVQDPGGRDLYHAE